MKRTCCRAALLTALLAIAGCSQAEGDHDHDSLGPHGGLLACWGDGEIEIVTDRDQRRATVYLLDDQGRPAPAALKQLQLVLARPVAQVVLEAQPQEGDPPGTASRFEGRHPALAPGRRFAGTVRARLDGRDRSAPFDQQYPGKKCCP
jgi:hypothetical protein